MARRSFSNKAKIAQRVVKVLEFLDEHMRPATVMDIARRFDWPQSSTSELLFILVETGLLYKDERSRTFMPTPRAALLGSGCQPKLVRDGRLSMLTEELRMRTGLSVAVMGKVCIDVQIFGWTAGATPISSERPMGLAAGMRVPLHENIAGWLLLSMLPARQCDGVLRRLRAEAPVDRKFQPAILNERIQTCATRGYGIGPAGFSSTAEMCAILLPSEPGDRPMVLGFVYEASHCPNPAPLIALLKQSAQTCASDSSNVGPRAAADVWRRPASTPEIQGRMSRGERV
jgi:DNA-binding IclR family transcriptional regulator